jgi:hypothetical protein
MNFEESLMVELNTVEGLTDRVFPLYVPEGQDAPFVVYVSSEGVNDTVLNGFLNSKSIDCEIHVIHKTYKGMKELTRLVLAKIHTFFGRQIGVDGVFIKSISIDTPTEVHEKEVKLYRSSFDIKVRL